MSTEQNDGGKFSLRGIGRAIRRFASSQDSLGGLESAIALVNRSKAKRERDQAIYGVELDPTEPLPDEFIDRLVGIVAQSSPANAERLREILKPQVGGTNGS